MQTYVPIAIYRLPGCKQWTADALGLAGATTDGRTQAEARENLELVLGHYVDLLTSDEPIQAIELEYLNELIAPPEGVDWLVVDLSHEARAARAKRRVPLTRSNKKIVKSRPPRRAASRPRKDNARSASVR